MKTENLYDNSTSTVKTEGYNPLKLEILIERLNKINNYWKIIIESSEMMDYKILEIGQVLALPIDLMANTQTHEVWEMDKDMLKMTYNHAVKQTINWSMNKENAETIYNILAEEQKKTAKGTKALIDLCVLILKLLKEIRDTIEKNLIASGTPFKIDEVEGALVYGIRHRKNK